MSKWLLGMIFGAFLTACQNLPSTPHLPKSMALTEQAHAIHNQLKQSKLTPAKALLKLTGNQIRTDLSAYYPISTATDAFVARKTLAQMAMYSIDVQYYIWHDDEAGLILLKALWDSAERGVTVRLLLDDFNSSPALDRYLFTFASHPNIAVRLTNPFNYRHSKTLSYIKHPIRQNVRMHNKSMIFDGHVSIIGGRNIGNEYLNNDNHNHFADLDVLLAGKVVNDVSQSFEDYWQSAHAYDIQTLTNTPLKHLPNDVQYQKIANIYDKATTHSTLKEQLNTGTIPFRWTNIAFFADDVKKLGRKADYDEYLVSKLRQTLPTPTKQLSIISSYFVPTKNGTKILTNLANHGVHISILTNALNATDVPTVHSGYAHWRKELLKAGVKIYELKNSASPKDTFQYQTATVSLHAKTFAIDGKRVFIGSYNIDPRSANINTELGVVIDDNELAKHIHYALNNPNSTNPNLLNQAYELGLDEHDSIIWKTLENGQEVIYHTEPASLPKRWGFSMLGVLPIDGLL